MIVGALINQNKNNLRFLLFIPIFQSIEFSFFSPICSDFPDKRINVSDEVAHQDEQFMENCFGTIFAITLQICCIFLRKTHFASHVSEKNLLMNATPCGVSKGKWFSKPTSQGAIFN